MTSKGVTNGRQDDFCHIIQYIYELQYLEMTKIPLFTMNKLTLEWMLGGELIQYITL